LKWHITGFVDGDGSFPVILSPVADKKFGWLIQPRFQIELRNNSDSFAMLKIIARTMHIKENIIQGDNFVKIIVTNRRLLLEKVIPFFQEYKPVLKQDDFQLLKYVSQSLDAKKHLEDEGFKEIARELFSLQKDGEDRRKWKITDLLKEKGVSVRPPSQLMFPEGIELRNYVSGFIDAEGAFGYVILPETKTLTPYLTITHQNAATLERIQKTLQCGNISTGRLQIYGVENMKNKIIPYLERYQPIAKHTAYGKFKEILQLVIAGRHKPEFEQTVAKIRSLNDRGILRDYTLGTYPARAGN
jgi:hypothetical protein